MCNTVWTYVLDRLCTNRKSGNIGCWARYSSTRTTIVRTEDRGCVKRKDGSGMLLPVICLVRIEMSRTSSALCTTAVLIRRFQCNPHHTLALLFSAVFFAFYFKSWFFLSSVHSLTVYKCYTADHSAIYLPFYVLLLN